MSINLKTTAIGGSARLYNDLAFRVEDSVCDLLATRQIDFVDAEIVPSLTSLLLDDDYVTVVADTCNYSDGPRLMGNWDVTVTVRIATYVENAVPAGFTDLREVHRQRVGVIADTIMQDNLHEQLSDNIDGGFTCQGYIFHQQTQGVEGHHWVTEITFVLAQCCGINTDTPEP